MAAATGFEAVAPFYVQRAPGAAPSGDYPAGGVPNIALRNPHLLYAITWYALAIVLLVIYVVFHVRRRGGAGAAKNEQNR
jgi:surfeit locus 1 family protein